MSVSVSVCVCGLVCEVVLWLSLFSGKGVPCLPGQSFGLLVSESMILVSVAHFTTYQECV